MDRMPRRQAVMLKHFGFIDGWNPTPSDFYQEGARIEAGFRKYFHRADASQVRSSQFLYPFLNLKIFFCPGETRGLLTCDNVFDSIRT